MANVINKPIYFEDAEWDNHIAKHDGWRLFRVGTVEGAWRSTNSTYEILAVVNKSPGNGHLDVMLGHFSASCRRDKKDFIIREMMNNQFALHLVKKGFTFFTKTDMIKRFK